MQFAGNWKIPLIIFLIALAVRISFLPFSIFDEGHFSPEAVAFDGYYELSENILAGNGFTRSSEAPFVPDSVRTPLYPYLLAGIALLFGNYEPIFFLQILLGSISTIFAWRIAREFLTPRASIIVGVLSAVEPLTAYLTGTVMTETLFLFLFFPSVWLLIRFFDQQKLWTLATASLLLGIATLIKPTMQYAPILLIPLLILIHGKNWKPLVFQSALFASIFVLILSPWMYRNYTTFGTTSLVVQPVSNLYAYLVPSTIAFEKGITYEEAAEEFFERENVGSIEDINLGNAVVFKERAVAELKKHKKGFAMSAGMTIFAFFTHDTYATILDRSDIRMSFEHPPISTLLTRPIEAMRFALTLMQRPEAFVLIGRLFWIITALLSAYGVTRYTFINGISPKLLFVAGLVGYFAATTIVIGLAVNGRFRVPIDPFIFVFTIFALQSIFQKRPDRDEPIA
ncbi:MAG: Uncharacterized protein G01um10148_323 [Parcubacteria group bacterium Gr01-1014_8]|nr:MAG: Uncharacterized protein G01um10148_323 [Parcubacteria group bacterium Gr01-1014_8]